MDRNARCINSLDHYTARSSNIASLKSLRWVVLELVVGSLNFLLWPELPSCGSLCSVALVVDHYVLSL